MIPIKTEKEINIMREGGKILAKIIDELKSRAVPGITTNELNMAAEALVFEYKAEPAFKGYLDSKSKAILPFPAALCASVNSVLVHAAPSDYKLKQGDILSLDLGIKYRGFYTDMAITFPVDRNGVPDSVNLTLTESGTPLAASFEVLRLIRVTKKALKLGIKKAKEGNTFGDIGNTIQRHIEGQGFGVVQELCGHGIGSNLHEEPRIPNFGKRRSGLKIERGMVFCIEPMTTIGDWRLQPSPDGFGYETKDGSLSCHFEHTIAITKSGPHVLTILT